MIKRTRFFGLVIAGLVFSSAAYAFAVYGAIGDKWKALGGAGGFLGEARTDESPAQFGGRFNHFAHGSIYWHPKTGAYSVTGAIGGRFAQLGWEVYGYPITDESTTPDGIGRYNHFRAVQLKGDPESSIYWTPQTGAQEIYGDIRKKWAAMGWERSSLGYPTTAERTEYEGSDIRRQDFQKGSLWWSPKTGVSLTPLGVASSQPPAQQPPAQHPPATPPSTPTPIVKYCTNGCEPCYRDGLKCSLNNDCNFKNVQNPYACF